MADSNDNFVKLFMPLQGDLLAFILSMGVPVNDADDVLQDAACIVLRKVSDFQEGTNFRAWVYAIVRNEVSNFLRNRKRRMLRLTDEAANDLQRMAADPDETQPIPLAMLSACLQRLQPKGRDLVALRYEQGKTVQQIAEQIKRPVESVYVTLSRIRKLLLECVQRQDSLERRST